MTTVAAEESGGFHGPSIQDFFPPAILFEGTFFQIDRITLVRLVALLAVVIFFSIATKNMNVIPSKLQSAGEWALRFVRVNIAEEVLGKKDAEKYLPLLATIFFTTLAFNITGVIPFLNIAGTSVVGLPFVMAVIVWVVFIVSGVKRNGAGKYFGGSLFPAGVPKPLYILVTPIEFISTFILRPATLTIRLLMNMVAGHLLLVLCFAATNFFLFEADGIFKALSVVTFAGGFAFTLFEILVAALQAYVFALLTAVYIESSLHVDH